MRNALVAGCWLVGALICLSQAHTVYPPRHLVDLFDLFAVGCVLMGAHALAKRSQTDRWLLAYGACGGGLVMLATAVMNQPLRTAIRFDDITPEGFMVFAIGFTMAMAAAAWGVGALTLRPSSRGSPPPN